MDAPQKQFRKKMGRKKKAFLLLFFLSVPFTLLAAKIFGSDVRESEFLGSGACMACGMG